MSIDITATTTADFSADIQRRLTDAERKPLRRFQSDALAFITDRWRGWRYAGRPKGAPRNVSQAKWRGKIQSTEPAVIGMTISNQARAWDSGEAYVAQVERRRGEGSEADRLIGLVVRDLWPQAVQSMATEIARELNKPAKPQRLRRNTGTSPTVTAAPIIL